ncbi:1588_t:CDS:2 [Paraglomus brasilianum]|uniref:1588_t:CDS:1 n=1 Tax=Paraglomus brasilianum TaxID=144538 RepID=A0A9N8W8V6_9GLOM|nr:1588_t:CDS:2 [Paraglomus brasilianum]
MAVNIADKIEQIALVLKTIAERRGEEKVAENSSGEVHPCIVLIQQMWESKIFDMLFANYAAHKQLSESLARLLKYCVVSYSKDFRPMLPTLMERLITAFGQTALSCYLWVATKCVREHADGEGNPVTLALISFVSRLSTVMFSTLSEAQVNGIPDVIEEYFRLNIACVDIVPATFVQSGILPPTFQAGIECLSIEQPDTLVAVLTFFSKLLSYAMTLKESQQPVVADLTSVNVSSSQPPSEVARHNLVHIETVIRQFGGELTYKMLYGNLYIFPRDFQTDVDSCFKYMVKLMPLESQQWMLDAVQRLPATNLTAKEKNKFVMDYNAQIQARDWSRLRRVLNDFTAIYRRRYVTSRRNRGDVL